MKVQLSTLALGLALVSSAVAVPAPKSHVIHEKRTRAPSSQWVNVGRVDPKHNVVVRIGLKQNNLDRGHEMLMDV